jgi:hypothetical protein
MNHVGAKQPLVVDIRQLSDMGIIRRLDAEGPTFRMGRDRAERSAERISGDGGFWCGIERESRLNS